MWPLLPDAVLPNLLDRLRLAAFRQQGRPADPVRFDVVETQLEHLWNATGWAVRQDRLEMRRFRERAELSADALLWPFLKAAGEARVDDLQGLERDVRTKVENSIAVHAQVPDDLEEAVAHWGDKWEALTSVRRRAQRLLQVSGWSGSAAESYASSTAPQLEALDALGASMRAAAEAISYSVTVNETAFEALAEHLKDSVRTIRGASAGWPLIYARTDAACRALAELLVNISKVEERGEVMARVASIISRDALSVQDAVAAHWPGVGRRNG